LALFPKFSYVSDVMRFRIFMIFKCLFLYMYHTTFIGVHSSRRSKIQVVFCCLVSVPHYQ